MRWSNSSLFVMQQCGERFRRKYIEGDRRPSGVNAKRGTAVHKVANVAHMRQLTAKQEGKPKEEYLKVVLPTDEEVKDIAADAFERALADGCSFNAEEREFGVEKLTGAAKDLAIRMSSNYNAVSAPRVDPVAVERRVEIRPTGIDAVIVGITDLVSVEPTVEDPLEAAVPEEGIATERRVRYEMREEEVVNDLKTSARAPKDGDAERSQQLSLYALIRGAETGKVPRRVRLRVLVENTRKGVTTYEQTAVRTDDDLNAVASRMQTAIEAAASGTFVPANPDSWWCSEKYCEFWGDCKFALGRKR